MILLSLLFVGLACLVYFSVHSNDYEQEFFKNVAAFVLGISGIALFVLSLFNFAN